MKRKNIERAKHLRRTQTDAERKLWSRLRNRRLAGIKFRRQFPISKYILDFYSPEYKLGVEADGGQHYTETNEQKDKKRTKDLTLLGVQILRFSDIDILKNIEGVCENILNIIEVNEESPSPKSSPLRGEDK